MLDLNPMIVAQLREKDDTFPNVNKGILVPMVCFVISLYNLPTLHHFNTALHVLNSNPPQHPHPRTPPFLLYRHLCPLVFS